MTTVHQLQSALVGAASDVWIASLYALTAMLVALVVPAAVFRWLQAGTFLAIAVLLAAHHSYVEFYRTPVLVFHMRYLLDPEFLSSSGTTAMTPMAALNLMIAAVAWWAGSLAGKLAPVAGKNSPPGGHLRKWLTIAGIMLAAIAIHAFQIKYRVQWFVPGTLQFHNLEKLVIDYARGVEVPPPTEGERELFAKAMAQRSQVDVKRLAAQQLRLALREAFARAVESKKIPVIAVLALESFRPSEIDVYASEQAGPDNQQSFELTPGFNQLARTGILFREAFSSGTVTCSGQEALWCGYQSGLYSSLMRVRPDLKVACAPKAFQAANGMPMWIHNGQGKFDNQASFWRNQGVSKIITQDDFSTGTPGTSWGLSDLALAERAANEVASARTTKTHDFVAPFILTVTNHIPWGLPADAPQAVRDLVAPTGQNARMWQTTAYTDAAIGKFVAGAKAAGFWDQMLLVLAADHGNKETPRHATTSGAIDSPARLQSHIALLLSGGLVEETLQYHPANKFIREITWPVGQAGVASLIEFMATGVESPGHPDILNWPESIPVISDQNETLFIPSLNLTVPRDEITSDQSRDAMLPDGQISGRNLALIRLKILANPEQSR